MKPKDYVFKDYELALIEGKKLTGSQKCQARAAPGPRNSRCKGPVDRSGKGPSCGSPGERAELSQCLGGSWPLFRGKWEPSRVLHTRLE